MKVRDLLDQVAMKNIWIEVEKRNTEISEEQCRELYRGFLEIETREREEEDWNLFLTEEQAYLFKKQEVDKHYSLQNFNENVIIDAHISIDQVGNIGATSYVTSLILAWFETRDFLTSEDSGCVELDERIPDCSKVAQS